MQSGCESRPLKDGGGQNNIGRLILPRHCFMLILLRVILFFIKAFALLLVSSIYVLLSLGFTQTMEATFVVLGALVKISPFSELLKAQSTQRQTSH